MGGGTTSQETTSTPWGPQADQLREYYSEAGSLYGTPQEYFPGSTVGGRDRRSILAGSATEQLGQKDYRQSGEAYIGQVLGGDFTEQGNPYLDDVYGSMASKVTEQFNRTVAPGINSRFAAAGRGTSSGRNTAMGMAQGQLGDSLGDLASNVYYQDYDRRTQDRMNALQIAPGIQGLEYADIGQQRGQGAIEEDYTQRLLNDSIGRFNFSQQEPEQRLDRFGGRVGQNLGFGTQTSTGSSSSGGTATGLGVLGLLTTLAGTAIGGPAGGLAGKLVGSTASGGFGNFGNYIA